ncbi:DUF2196 domain-containing protein [Clostridium perfringens]|uniref:Uncharacterized protein n=1 Tax=Clostridium perfringens TaxID=1502 RepID=A0A140GRW5_CLOPF|nr:DUF2196 domain-containing protein [Clostridium perfringens]AMN31274.1 hypothetical protein JFP838_pA0358 [Clostridium perfringens]
MFLDERKIKNIVIGLYVGIIDDKEKKLGDEAPIRRGYVKKILSKEDNEKGIKVELSNGRKGRVYEIYSKNDIRKETFKFYNEFFYEKRIYSLWDKTKNKYVLSIADNKITNAKELVAFLFSNDDKAKEFLKKLNNKNICIKAVSRKIKVAENFKGMNISKFRINDERNIAYEKLVDIESYVTQQ